MSNKLYRWQQLAAALELADFFIHEAAAAARFRYGRDDFGDKDIQKVLSISEQIFDLREYFYNQLNAEDQQNWRDHIDIFFGDAELGDQKSHKYTKEKHEIELWLLKEAAQYKSLHIAAPTIKRSLEEEIDFEDSN
ncbi:hypothetical protein lacNasYZ03_05590 [Lactobacillus nasalidis]|uniref:Uncharacterized protein n=1 Tax=Lactobacillus nasalidis TaxID=2797258 RepID=A0ABQ3W7J9_9LACO|nr:hypothetical protein [Lactobacillus nasalidis]GHV97345.1 hypothetical protein lacNasYZ01_05270 [Lactobacillus nasalidis]GHV99941.1 hypothetical protein lacNasYZ02_13710 [Lactobacillus nasalidis]GHW00872.1 hypothetical protein lacNasYZ03_05590 [Lactobacillus nasalidis]